MASTTVDRPWNRGGLSRTNTLTDGSANEEDLLGVDRPFSFSYRIHGFTDSVQSGLLEAIFGRWYFLDNGDETTSIDWRYILVPIDDAAREAVETELIPRYRSRLDTALERVRALVEGAGRDR